jgi:hypothetical protein
MLKSWSDTFVPTAPRSANSAAHRALAAPAHVPHAPRPLGPRAKLNVFQRLVRQWETLHPYNGAQVLKIRGNVDIELCRNAWFDALESLNLGVVCLSENTYRYRCLNGEAMYHGITLCPPQTDLNEFISHQLNRPFDPRGDVPFRPFVIQKPGFFFMGLCYQHWTADSTSIRFLIHEWFTRQYDPPKAARRVLRFHAGGYFSLFGPHRSGRPAEVFLSSLRWQSQFKIARRIEDRQRFGDLTVRFTTVDAPPGMIQSLCQSARKLNVKVNDLFLAAIARVCDQCVPAERKFRRRQLAIGSIVDLRPSAKKSANDLFDLLLGFTSIACQDQQLVDLPALVRSVARQTHEQKRGGLPLASCLRMAAGLAIGKWLSRESIIEFYRKRIPLAGASSNVNLNHCWAGKYADNPILDYIRVAPTGPMTPLVFSTTTLGDTLSISLTYRSAIIPPDQADLLCQKFISQLEKLIELAAE